MAESARVAADARQARPARAEAPAPIPLFRSFYQAGFECSTHRLRTGRRLDLVASTRHDACAAADYARCAAAGLHTVRDGVRWHLADGGAAGGGGVLDLAAERPRVRAARDAGVQVIWDLCHYGWPDDVDVLSPAFVDRFARFARAFAALVADETDEVPWYAPVNEISFFAWAGGDAGYLNPFRNGAGGALKRQLVRAAIAAVHAVRDVDPRARVVHTDPVFWIVPHVDRPHEGAAARGHNEAQFESWDMLAGRTALELGGSPDVLDVVGVNYYSNNQWVWAGPLAFRNEVLAADDPRYRPFRELLGLVGRRYGRPLFVAETGTEGEARPTWLRYMADEVRGAQRAGVEVEGLCIYPVVDHPGWDDDRHCPNGLWGYADASGSRPAYAPLLDELQRQQRRLGGR
ncbi:MAG TPA: hypothetical protein VGD56_10350 [Gemmatirosa sp.]